LRDAEYRERMESSGLVRFDGETWTHYLPGEVVLDIALAPDGSIWHIT
jgi:hypothetical protein